ncbi:Ras protein, variant 2 [Coprinopsis cinerea AmutBmut pab1-1]|nr:Ras protein, variant 2 [Coprinopsis cinerea AmutBmut pab1-1]
MGILLVYDVTDERSFNNIRTWHANIEQHASEGVNKILIGNKSDWTDKRAVTEEQGRELANELGIKFMETSAKVNEGVEEAFFTLARSVSFRVPRSSMGLCIGYSSTPCVMYPQRHQDPLDRFAGRCRWYPWWARNRLCKGQPTHCAVAAGMLFIKNSLSSC